MKKALLMAICLIFAVSASFAQERRSSSGSGGRGSSSNSSTSNKTSENRNEKAAAARQERSESPPVQPRNANSGKPSNPSKSSVSAAKAANLQNSKPAPAAAVRYNRTNSSPGTQKQNNIAVAKPANKAQKTSVRGNDDRRPVQNNVSRQANTNNSGSVSSNHVRNNSNNSNNLNNNVRHDSRMVNRHPNNLNNNNVRHDSRTVNRHPNNNNTVNNYYVSRPPARPPVVIIRPWPLSPFRYWWWWPSRHYSRFHFFAPSFIPYNSMATISYINHNYSFFTSERLAADYTMLSDDDEVFEQEEGDLSQIKLQNTRFTIENNNSYIGFVIDNGSKHYISAISFKVTIRTSDDAETIDGIFYKLDIPLEPYGKQFYKIPLDGTLQLPASYAVFAALESITMPSGATIDR